MTEAGTREHRADGRPASSNDTSLISAQCAQNAVMLAASDTTDAMRSVPTSRRPMPCCHADAPCASQWRPSSADDDGEPGILDRHRHEPQETDEAVVHPFTLNV